jgi:hypothetical protein
MLKHFTLLAAASAAAPTAYPAADARFFTWSGRGVVTSNASFTFDLPGTTLDFAVVNATYIGLQVIDNTFGGARLGVYLDSTGAFAGERGDPNPAGAAIPGLRVATLLTSRLQTLYTLASGGQIARLNATNIVRVRLALLSEWSMMADRVGENFTVSGIVTDGALLPAPRARARRFLVLGDSLSSGVGAGFDVPPGQVCGAGVAVDDWAQTWNALLCANFSAACEVIAQSGVTIVGDSHYNLPMSIPYALGAMGSPDWPEAARVPWHAAAAPVDAVFIELGENDCHAFNCTAPDGAAKLVAAYKGLVRNLAGNYSAAIPFFFTLANHEAGQSVAMNLAIAALAGDFPRVALLNGTSPNVDPRSGANIDTGCAGHPSAAQNLLAFARMQPVVAAALASV